MAKVKGPLMSLEASGIVGQDLLFRASQERAYAYRPADRAKANPGPASAAQTSVRARYQEAATAWRALAETDRAAWEARARRDQRNVHGWAMFLEAWPKTGPPPSPRDPSTYIPPPGDACDFPGYTWVSDTAYTAPPGDTWT